MNVLDLFSGKVANTNGHNESIGFVQRYWWVSLGLERTGGFETVAFAEIDPYCQRVLRKHWPDVPVYDDVRNLKAAPVDDTEGGTMWNDGKNERSFLREINSPTGPSLRCRIDVICGGFPCQDISVAGKGAGIDGERSGLWKEYARIIGEVQPRYAIIENVAALLHRGLSDVLFDLSALGYDAEWHCIPASAVGAPHRRDRVWIVAYPNGGRQQQYNDDEWPISEPDAGCDVADADQPRLSFGDMLAGILHGKGSGHAREDAPLGSWWQSEPDMGRVAHGVPARVDRLRSLGNAVVPQIVTLIGRAIMMTARAGV